MDVGSSVLNSGLIDLVEYAAIGKMCLQGLFPAAEFLIDRDKLHFGD